MVAPRSWSISDTSKRSQDSYLKTAMLPVRDASGLLRRQDLLQSRWLARVLNGRRQLSSLKTTCCRLAADRACRLGKHVVGLTADKADRADNDHQNDGEHYRVLRDIFALILQPHFAQKLFHCSSIFV